jgi:tetratricopeptide (TPR) repeat protein
MLRIFFRLDNPSAAFTGFSKKVSPISLIVGALLYFGAPSWADSFAQIAEQSRHEIDAGRWEEAKAILETGLAKTTDAVEIDRLKAELAHYQVERNTYFHRETNTVNAALNEARTAAEQTGDSRARAILEMAEGRFTYFTALDGTNEWGLPTEHLERALQLYKETGDETGVAEALFYRGLVYQMQQQTQQAREVFTQAFELTEKTADERMRSFVVRHLGYLQQDAGNIDQARADFRESLELRQKNDMKVFVPFALIALAEFESEQKNSSTAISLLEQALPLAESGNSPVALYAAQLQLAKLYAEQGKVAEARKLAQASQEGAKAFGNLQAAKEASDFLKNHN